MATIYDLTSDMAYLQGLLLQDPSPEIEEEIKQLLTITADRLEDKAVSYVHVIKNLEAEVAGIKAEETRLADRRKKREKSIERLKTTLFEAMVRTGKTAFERGNFSFKIARNGGALPVILDVSAEDLPDELVTIKREPDKKAITTYIEETGDLSYAHFAERGQSLRIK